MKELLKGMLKSAFSDHRAHMDHRLDDLENRVGWVDDRVNDRAADLLARMDRLESNVTVDTQTAAEFAATFRRATEALHERVDALVQLVTAGTDTRLPELIHRASTGDAEAELELAKLLEQLVPGVTDRLLEERATPEM